ncbi:hypothetical protein GCM10022221_06130 [Actinocorallia aurea]|uniref:Uncharacterized protein n=1 Tax=Actinocorallia herbida TaxID=58109 RepID=A0A3N1CNZ5_9ACTN|nr:hypothetical protein [Actinocorallia herbida]ROO83049.1 hypothetical protein EDD29_0538 [Actinocorallia herbida]
MYEGDRAGEADPVAAFVARLNRALLSADISNTSELARLAARLLAKGEISTSLARSTVDDHLKGNRAGLPDWKLVRAIVRVCRATATPEGLAEIGTERQWGDWYAAAQQDLQRARRAPRPGSPPRPVHDVLPAPVTESGPLDGDALDDAFAIYAGGDGEHDDRLLAAWPQGASTWPPDDQLQPPPGPSLAEYIVMSPARFEREVAELYGDEDLRYGLVPLPTADFDQIAADWMTAQYGRTGGRLYRQAVATSPERPRSAYLIAVLLGCDGFTRHSTAWLSIAARAGYQRAIELATYPDLTLGCSITAHLIGNEYERRPQTARISHVFFQASSRAASTAQKTS